MTRAFVLAVAIGCSGSSPHNAPADARPSEPADAALEDAAPDDAALADAALADAALADAALPDAALPDAVLPDAVLPDAPPAPDDGCPHRTAPPGVPEHPYDPAEVFQGNVTLRTPADLALLSGIKMIAGDLAIEGSLTSVSLPDLEVVQGSVTAVSDVIDELHLPRLETIGGLLQAHRTPTFGNLAVVEAPRVDSILGVDLVLSTANLSCLTAATEGLTVIGLTGPTFGLPKLVTATSVSLGELDAAEVNIPALQHGEFQILAGALTTLHLGNPDIMDLGPAVPNLTTVTMSSASNVTVADIRSGNLHDVDFLAGATRLTWVWLAQLPTLQSIAGLAASPLTTAFIEGTPNLVDFSPIAGAPMSEDLGISQTGATTLALPSVTVMAGGVHIEHNPDLTSLSMPNLTRVGIGASGSAESAISNNPLLPNCQATAIRAHVTVDPGTRFRIKGNLPDTCTSLARRRRR